MGIGMPRKNSNKEPMIVSGEVLMLKVVSGSVALTSAKGCHQARDKGTDQQRYEYP